MVAIPATVTNQQLQIRKFTRTFVHGRDPEDATVSDREEERTERRERWGEREMVSGGEVSGRDDYCSSEYRG